MLGMVGETFWHQFKSDNMDMEIERMGTKRGKERKKNEYLVNCNVDDDNGENSKKMAFKQKKRGE